jgi:MFS family permease
MDTIVTPTHTLRPCVSLPCCKRGLLFANFAIASALTITLPVLLSWLAARLQLGRAPRPSFDAPTRLEGFAAFVHAASELLLPAMFGLFFAATAITVLWGFFPRAHGRRAFTRLAISLLAFAASLLLTYWAPARSSPGG